MKLYHVTQRANLESILSSGLMPLEDVIGNETEAIEQYLSRWPEAGELAFYHITCVHLYRTQEEAEDNADIYGDNTVILAVDINSDDERLDVDELEYPHPIYYGVIPPDRIQVV